MFVFWTIVDVSLLFVLLIGVFFYLVSGAFIDVRLAASLGQNASITHALVNRVAPVGLAVGSARQISVVSGKYDFFTEIENVNDNWYATFDYSYTYTGGITETYQGFINPNETRLLPALNQTVVTRPSGLQLSIQDLVWHRVDKHVVADTAQFLAEHANITVDKATYSKDVVVGEEQFGRSTITLTNHTAYAYWSPEFLVKLTRADKSLVSLTKISVPEFQANETREVEVRWFGQVPPSGSISIEPMIFYFDPRVYMNPDDEIGPDVRR